MWGWLLARPGGVLVGSGNRGLDADVPGDQVGGVGAGLQPDQDLSSGAVVLPAAVQAVDRLPWPVAHRHVPPGGTDPGPPPDPVDELPFGPLRRAAWLLAGGQQRFQPHVPCFFVGLPLWLADHTRVPVPLIGVLVVINTVMAVALQARFAERAGRLAGAVDCMVRAGLALAGFAAVAYLMGRVQAVAAAALLAVLAVVLLTCSELWQAAGGWAISYELAPRERQAQYLATFQLGTAVQAMAAAAIVVGLVLPHSFGWLGLALVTAVAGLLVRPAVRGAR
jgi:hypothetical protein